MPDRGEHVVCLGTTVLHQVCVVVLGMGDDPRSLPATLAEVTAGPAPLVVIDALGLEEISPLTRSRLVAAHLRLCARGRRLIVVNVPPDAVPPLREHGIDVGVTDDHVFAADPAVAIVQRQANTGCS